MCRGKQTFRVCLFIALLILAVGSLSVAVRAADWSNTIAAATLDRDLYTIEKGGALYRTDLSTGKWSQIGKADFANTRMLIAGPKNLFTIENDGSLYRVSPLDGTWSRVGKAGEWRNTITGIFYETRLFTVESGGGLYGTNPISGVWAQVGKSEFGNTRRLMSTNEALYSIEKDGSLYRISPANGAWAQVGQSGSWKNTIAAATYGNIIYTVESGGGLYETRASTGAWKQVGKSEFANTMYLFYANDSLYTMEKGGIYAVSPVNGSWVKIDK